MQLNNFGNTFDKLSDTFEIPTEEPELELKVLMLNINYGKNKKLMEACKTLKDYSIYVHKVRTYAEKMPIEKAVDRAVEECIKEGVLEDFLRKYRAEVKQVSICEYDHEKEMKMIREDEREIGRRAGILQGLKALVSTLKPILVDFDEVYQAIKKNEEYADVTEEEVRKYF